LSFLEAGEQSKKYNTDIGTTLYLPNKNRKPLLGELCSNTKALELQEKINAANISKEEKLFLILASYRHIVFNYELIADYYTHSDKATQELMEDSALIIIDFNQET
jgi:hypothetical protein